MNSLKVICDSVDGAASFDALCLADIVITIPDTRTCGQYILTPLGLIGTGEVCLFALVGGLLSPTQRRQTENYGVTGAFVAGIAGVLWTRDIPLPPYRHIEIGVIQ